MGGWRAGIDIGGTFTDLLLVDEASGSFAVGKVLTTPSNPAEGVHDGADRASSRAAASPVPTSGTVVHGTTLVTNAIIERKGTPTALMTTAGFRDVLLIGREHRYDMYDVRLEAGPAGPASPELRRAGAGAGRRDHPPAARRGRGGHAGPSDLRAIGVRAVGRLPAARLSPPGPRARGCGRSSSEICPDSASPLSHEVVGELREYERASTTVANAYVLEIIDRYLGQLEADLHGSATAAQFLIMLVERRRRHHRDSAGASRCG